MTARQRQVRQALRAQRLHRWRYRVWVGVPLWVAAAVADVVDVVLHARGFLYFAVLLAVLLWSAKGPR